MAIVDSENCTSLNINLLRETDAVYELSEQIDVDVFVVRHTNTCARFVVKRVDLLTIDDNELEDVKNDVMTTRLLKHRNLLPYLDSFVNRSLNEIWILSPLCEYGSASNLSKELKLQEASISFMIRDTLYALEYLHNRGIIHRAVRASHILVHGPTGKCLLTGLKYSTSVIHDGKWQLAIHEYPSNAKPNLKWLSPELLEQNLIGYSAKSDIYSLGITCCELANGCVPFDDIKPTEMLLDKLTGNFPRLIDSTYHDLRKLNRNDMSEDEKKRIDIYMSRRFSDAFHTFTVDLCLGSDPDHRPNATQLLRHNFITKQLSQKKKPSNLLASLEADGITPCLKNHFKTRKPSVATTAATEDAEWEF